MNDFDIEILPLFKYYQSRLKVMAKQVPKEMVAGDQSSEDESTIVQKKHIGTNSRKENIQKGKGMKKSQEIGGTDDVLEDFTLTSDEGEESDS